MHCQFLKVEVCSCITFQDGKSVHFFLGEVMGSKNRSAFLRKVLVDDFPHFFRW